MKFVRLAFSKRPLVEGETPALVYERVRSENCFMFSSADGRFSYVCFDPVLIFKGRGELIEGTCKHDWFNYSKRQGNFIPDGEWKQVLADIVDEFQFKSDVPVPFIGGLVGYFSYDFGCRVNGVVQKAHDDLRLNDFVFCMVNKVVAFDRLANEVYFLASAETDLAAKRVLAEVESAVLSVPPLRRSGECGDVVFDERGADYLALIDEKMKMVGLERLSVLNRKKVPCTRDIFGVFRHTESDHDFLAEYRDFGFFADYGAVVFDSNFYSGGTRLGSKKFIELLSGLSLNSEMAGVPPDKAALVIDELEDYSRGVASGLIGCIGFDGTAQFVVASNVNLVKDGSLFLYY